MKYIPKPVSRFLFRSIRSLIVPQINRNQPKKLYELERKHLTDAKLLTNREALLELLPKNAVVAEIGVDQGDFSETILNTCTPQKLHLVDAWDTSRYGKDKENAVRKKFSNEIDQNQMAIHIGYSTDVIDQFEDNYFDWIYIDTDHSYPTTIAELEGYLPKMKEGGIITGHDYVSGSWLSMVRYGVIEAVHEFCVKHDWEIIYLTVEKKVPGSFGIRKIGCDN